MANHFIQRRRKSGPTVDIDDPAFRSKVISIAAQGGSRRTVAALVGKPEATLRTWINRGEAYPDEEPYGSFSRDYQRAERGVAGAVAGLTALKIRSLIEQAQAAVEWRGDPLDAPPMPNVIELEWAQRAVERRHPEDYGTTKHRAADVPYNADEYLDSNAMTREQLGAVFSDPPEKIRQALVDQAPAVYRILLEAGFDPSAPAKRKATDDDDSDAQGMDRANGAQHAMDPDEGTSGGAD